MSTCPPNMSVTAVAAPLYGMTTISMPVLTRNSSPVRCAKVPAGVPKFKLAGIAARIGDEFRQRLGRHRRGDNKCKLRAGEHRNRDKVLERVVTCILGKQGTGHKRGHTADQQSVTVGLGRRRGPGPDGAAGTRSVVDHDLLPKRGREPLRDQN